MRYAVIPHSEHWEKFGFDILATGMGHVLEDLGFHVVTMDKNEVRPCDFGPRDIAVFLENHEAMKWDLRAEKTGPGEALKVFFSMDPLRRRTVDHAKNFHYDVILDYNPRHVGRWKREGWPRVAYCPQGYHESYEDQVEPPAFSSGVHFLGDFGSKKRRMFQEIAEAEGLEIRSGVYETRRAAMAHASSPGVHLNINRSSHLTFGWIRILMMYLVSGSFVLSENLSWAPEGLTAGEHWDTAPFEEVPRRAKYWLERPMERQAIAAAGKAFFRENHRLDEGLARALRKVRVI